MHFKLWPLLFLFTVQAFALESVDHTHLWARISDQGDSQACHIYVAIGLLEAEWQKQYPGTSVDLSEGHLFSRHIFGDSQAVLAARLQRFQQDAALGIRRTLTSQPGWIGESVRLAQQSGLYLETEFPSGRFLEAIQGLDRSVVQLIAGEEVTSAASEESWAFWYRSAQTLSFAGLSELRYVEVGLPRRGAVDMLRLIFERLPHRPMGAVIEGSLVGLNGKHSVIIAGYDRPRQEFILRDSGGLPNEAGIKRVNQIDFLEALWSVGFIEGPVLSGMP